MHRGPVIAMLIIDLIAQKKIDGWILEAHVQNTPIIPHAGTVQTAVLFYILEHKLNSDWS